MQVQTIEVKNVDMVDEGFCVLKNPGENSLKTDAVVYLQDKKKKTLARIWHINNGVMKVSKIITSPEMAMRTKQTFLHQYV